MEKIINSQPITPATERCSNCQFFLKAPMAHKLDRCRRFPPSMTETTFNGMSEYPVVSDSGWCGEFKLVESGER